MYEHTNISVKHVFVCAVFSSIGDRASPAASLRKTEKGRSRARRFELLLEVPLRSVHPLGPGLPAQGIKLGLQVRARRRRSARVSRDALRVHAVPYERRRGGEEGRFGPAPVSQSENAAVLHGTFRVSRRLGALRRTCRSQIRGSSGIATHPTTKQHPMRRPASLLRL